jgi:hypothetical protein
MRPFVTTVLLGLFAAVAPSGAAADAADVPILQARVVAVGIPGAGALSAVGVFHPGGPIHDNPAFAAMTAPGRVLDPARVLVTSTANFGSPRIPGFAEGAILSIDPSGTTTIVVPTAFAAAGGQATAVDGRVQLFSAASPAFVNGVNSPKAVTAEFPAVSNPLGISINNAFGRLWFPSSPRGAAGAGFESIVDPSGIPLAKAPHVVAGGVFTETKTSRSPQLVPGAIAGGLIANAFVGASSDGSKRAVFAALGADGSLVQIHTEQGLDGLAPAGTITPQRGRAERAGMLFNWVPNRILYVTDAAANAILAIPVADDGKVFTTGPARRITDAALHAPFDLAPAVPESANGVFSSNTTLAGGSDLYVLNGDGTIARLRQDGTVVAVRRVSVPGAGVLGAGRLAGIATAPDAAHLWLTVSGSLAAQPAGAVIEVPAFGARVARAALPATLARAGNAAFRRTFDPQSGLGPLFNERSCIACHQTPSAGGMGRDGLAVVLRVARLDSAFDPLLGHGGPVARAHSVSELGFACGLTAGVPAEANAISVRNAPALFNMGAIDALDERAIVESAIAYPDGVYGRPNWIAAPDGTRRAGRFGWKADTVTLEAFVAQAFRNELGMTSPLEPRDLVESRPGDPRCAGEHEAPEDDGTLVRAVTAFVATLQPPSTPCVRCGAGASVFASIGCAECHATRVLAPSQRPLYSDLLLHDMGPALDDGFVQGAARGVDWRTTPLAGLATRRRLLHDGRAITVADALLAHDGEASRAARAFRTLDAQSRFALITFLNTL